jgi:hypothetical protein
MYLWLPLSDLFNQVFFSVPGSRAKDVPRFVTETRFFQWHCYGIISTNLSTVLAEIRAKKSQET